MTAKDLNFHLDTLNLHFSINKKVFYWRLCTDIGPCHVSGIFLPLRVNSLPLATIYEVKIPLRK
jgi:hypothetical protein